MMYAPDQLNAMIQLIDTQLHINRKMSKGELIWFFGTMILPTSFQFNGRHDFWTATQLWIHLFGAPKFGEKTSSRHRFDDIWRHLRWSYQPRARPEGKSWEKYRWRLVDDHVARFNDHRESYFVPSGSLLTSLWLAGTIDRKPENGCKIQNAACGQSGVMMR
jgi:Transposase IS4